VELPVEFKLRMQEMLGDEAIDFLAAYNELPYHGLRVNRLKISVDEFLRISPFNLKPIPWTTDGFYYERTARPGKHPYYHAGLYYIQEPSAMAPAALLDVKPGERVLDLCAAPGGKSTQILSSLKGKGILVANDSNTQRTKALVRNLEAWGAKNILVTNETPERLVTKFAGYFDKILIDAPCSGEGMFRKDEEAIRSWRNYNVESCGLKQRSILQEAAKMLRVGGEIIYSTCTFAPYENEGTIEDFLKAHPEFVLVELPKTNGFRPGRPEWVNGRAELAYSIRLWPHALQGEGHFIAKMRKKDGVDCPVRLGEQQEKIDPQTFNDFLHFAQENLSAAPSGEFVLLWVAFIFVSRTVARLKRN